MQLVREKVYAMEQTHMTLKQKWVIVNSSFCRVPSALDFPDTRECLFLRSHRQSRISIFLTH